MVKISDDIEGIATVYLDNSSINLKAMDSLTAFQKACCSFKNFVLLLSVLKQYNLFRSEQVFIEAYSLYLYQDPQLVIVDGVVDQQLDRRSIIKNSPMTLSVPSDEVGNELFWRKMFKQVSDSDFSIPDDMRIDGERSYILRGGNIGLKGQLQYMEEEHRVPI